MKPQIGIGTDVHRLKIGRPMILGGIQWPDEPAGLAGHSDGDCLIHAVVDALLSAAGLGDIGQLFGTSDPKWAGASSLEFLVHATKRVQDAGFEVGNVAVQVIGESPRIGQRRAEIQKTLGDIIGAPVSVSGTTSDGLGLTGRGEGIAAIATAIIFK